MLYRLKNKIIVFLGGMPPYEVTKILHDEEMIRLDEQKRHKHAVHFPEYRDYEGVLHMHACSRGNWSERNQCVENEKGDISGAKQWLAKNRRSE